MWGKLGGLEGGEVVEDLGLDLGEPGLEGRRERPEPEVPALDRQDVNLLG